MVELIQSGPSLTRGPCSRIAALHSTLQERESIRQQVAGSISAEAAWAGQVGSTKQG